ncbi:Unknown protein, partial [Striga hermonthica]
WIKTTHNLCLYKASSSCYFSYRRINRKSNVCSPTLVCEFTYKIVLEIGPTSGFLHTYRVRNRTNIRVSSQLSRSTKASARVLATYRLEIKASARVSKQIELRQIHDLHH